MFVSDGRSDAGRAGRRCGVAVRGSLGPHQECGGVKKNPPESSGNASSDPRIGAWVGKHPRMAARPVGRGRWGGRGARGIFFNLEREIKKVLVPVCPHRRVAGGRWVVFRHITAAGAPDPLTPTSMTPSYAVMHPSCDAVMVTTHSIAKENSKWK